MTNLSNQWIAHDEAIKSLIAKDILDISSFYSDMGKLDKYKKTSFLQWLGYDIGYETPPTKKWWQKIFN